jgi:endonuclease G
MKKIFHLFVFILVVSNCFSQHDSSRQHYPLTVFNDTLPLHKIINLEIPKTHTNEIITKHFAYSLLYNEKHEQANWVAYELTKEETAKLFSRSNKFIPDPLISTGSAVDADYKKSGYDRGHLAPAADMAWSEQSMTESFYFSNMSPQNPNFNRGIWKKLEEQVRDWAFEYGNICIVTGPILNDSLISIGENKVSVPHYYYKVILDRTEHHTKAIGFIIPNKASGDSLQHFVCSIDEVEKITGIDFFYHLPDALENKLEGEICLSCWKWRVVRRKKK